MKNKHQKLIEKVVESYHKKLESEVLAAILRGEDPVIVTSSGKPWNAHVVDASEIYSDFHDHTDRSLYDKPLPVTAIYDHFTPAHVLDERKEQPQEEEKDQLDCDACPNRIKHMPSGTNHHGVAVSPCFNCSVAFEPDMPEEEKEEDCPEEETAKAEKKKEKEYIRSEWSPVMEKRPERITSATEILKDRYPHLRDIPAGARMKFMGKSPESWKEEKAVFDEIAPINKERYQSLGKKDDVLDHPAHYTDVGIPSGIECWDHYELAMTEEEFRGAMKNNIYKYIFRAGRKDLEKTIEDLNKAIRYLQRWIKFEEGNRIVWMRGKKADNK